MRTVFVALGAALVLAGCGSDDPAAPPSPPATTAVAGPVVTPTFLTRDPQVIASTLRNAATAEESYFLDAGTYTKKMADLVAEGLPSETRVKLRIISASKTRYCLSGEGRAGLVYYYDSKDGKITRTPCK